MPKNITIPSLGDSISQATILRWLAKDGDYIQASQPLVELETDKTNTELPAEVSGTVRQTKPAGQVVQIGDVIGRIEEGAAPPAAKKPEQSAGAASSASSNASASSASGSSTSGKSATATAPPSASATGASKSSADDDLNPAVRRLVEENKLDPASIPATGPHGRLLKEDVVRYLQTKGNGNGNGKTEAAAARAETPAARAESPRKEAATVGQPPASPASASAPPPLSEITTIPGEGEISFNSDGIARVPMSKIRRRIAQNLLQAQQTAAILTTFNEADMTAIMDLRARYKERFEKLHGIGLGFMSFFARAAVLCLRQFPRVNAFIEGDDVVYHNYVNLGIAVSTERGLAVPVLRNVERMSFAKVESEIKRVAAAVRDGKLALQELSGGTFTITNGGVFGSLLSTPILNPPQSAILGMHAIQKRPVVVNDKVEVRSMMYLALSYDHRLVDGRDSVTFLVRLKEYLEDPARLMLEV